VVGVGTGGLGMCSKAMSGYGEGTEFGVSLGK
jgi:hypothetical protein